MCFRAQYSWGKERKCIGRVKERLGNFETMHNLLWFDILSDNPLRPKFDFTLSPSKPRFGSGKKVQKTRSKGASLLKWFQTVKASRHYLLHIPDVRRNHTLLFFPLKIISVSEIYSDSLFHKRTAPKLKTVTWYSTWD